jgi:hypothetical protein
MDGMLQPPSATAFDAVASGVSLLVYLGVALAAIARSPGDARARTFLAVAIASAVPYALSPLQWWKGSGAYTAAVIALTASSFALGSVALFHFTQVFPRRRPFVAAHFAWVLAAYLLVPVPAAVVAWVVGQLMTSVVDTGSGGLGAVLSIEATVLLLLIIPLIFVAGIVMPLAGVMSLFKSWQESGGDGRARDREATLWMLVSQLGGGVLAILVLPMLHRVGIGAPWSLVIAVLSYAVALLLPLAFARYPLSTSTG